MISRAATFGLWAGVIGVVLASDPAALAQVRQDLWVPNGTVAATTLLGNTVYLGGNFTKVGLPTGGAPLDPVTGQP